MGQRINIQYSVEIDDLEQEIKRLLNNAYAHYGHVSDQCCTTTESVLLSHQTLENIDKLRLELSAIDHQLNDIVNIIGGYLSYRAQPAERAHGEDMQNKITQFKNLLQELPEADEIPDQG